MKRILSIFSYLICIFVLTGCPSPISNNMYYMQQSVAGKDGSIGGPNIDWGDSDEGTGGSGSVAPPLNSGEISMFSALQIDGVVLEMASSKVAGKMGGTDASYTGYLYNTATFKNWKILGNFTSANVPNLWYDGTASWSAHSSDGTNMQFFDGPNSSAGSNSITNMRYYRYVGVNPFFGPTSSYNTAEYNLYDKFEGTTIPASTGKEAFMKRFHFYRFTGKGGGVAAIDNWLVAVDTYTKLVFSFAKPTKWGSLLGNALPLEWGPVDLVSTGPGGKKYKFYEYDPSGYVAEDGKFHMTDTYRNNLGAGNYEPAFTGKSPYLGILKVNADGSVSGGGETKYEVSGALTVKAKYIKNVSMTDAWGDHGNSDGRDKPEFIYSVRSRAYEGFVAGDWNVMSSYKPDDLDISPSGAKTIQKGTTYDLGGGKEYEFKDIKSGLTLELDSRIIEIDISGNDSLTNYEIPVIFLGYERFSQKWTPTTDNATYLRGPLEYDKNFEVGLGETKDFIVTIPAGYGEEIELCYEISWKSDGNTGAGRIFSAQTKNNGEKDDYQFSGSNGEYTIKYIDFTEVSSKEDKIATIELSLGNLLSEVPVRVEYEIDNTISGFIGKPKFNDENHGDAILTADKSKLRIEIPVAYSPSINQTGTLTLTLSDTSGALGAYDMGDDRSPKEIVINIERGKFIPISDATMKISNVKLQNLSVMDVGGDSPAGGYDEPEFSWSIKTRHNEGEWDDLSSNDGRNVIQINKDKDAGRVLSGENSHPITNPREGKQNIYFSAEITEKDGLAGNANDVIMQHEKPLIELGYDPLADSWNLTGRTAFYYTNGTDMQWQIKKITMEDVKRGDGAQTVTVSLSSYIYDTIWPSDNIADWINGPITAGWGDMELTFDVEWK